MFFECSICNETGESDNGICATIPCGHVYHNKCLKNWQDLGKKTCPVCRKVFLQTIELYGVNPNCDEANGGYPTNLSEDYKTLQEKYNKRREEHKKLQARYNKVIEDYSAERNLRHQTERNLESATTKKLKAETSNAEIEKKLNEALFKLSMYQELFGEECSRQFDEVIYNDQVEGAVGNMNNLNIRDDSDDDNDDGDEEAVDDSVIMEDEVEEIEQPRASAVV